MLTVAERFADGLGTGALSRPADGLAVSGQSFRALFHSVRTFQDHLPGPQQMAHAGMTGLRRRTEPANKQIKWQFEVVTL